MTESTTGRQIGIPEGITREDVEKALHDLDAEVEHGFGRSTTYDLLWEGRRYPPKAVVGLAARRVLGRVLEHHEFSGGEDKPSFRLLRDLGFEVVPKAGGGPAELPEHPPERVWIEFRRERGQGGAGWDEGTCLWSPTRSKNNADSYSVMRQVQPGDLVLHVLEGDFFGYSWADGTYTEHHEGPANPDPWEPPFYRVDLRAFVEFPEPLPVPEFLARNAAALEALVAQPDLPKFYPFIKQAGRLQKYQGAYLSPCPHDLYQLIRASLQGPTGRAGAERYWAIGLGEGGRLWNECQEAGLIVIGWDQLGDLTSYPDHASIKRAIKERIEPDSEPTNDALACWQFSREMKVGDYVVAKVGRRRALGVGRITSDYAYDPSRHEYQHLRHVKWLKAATLEIPPGTYLPTKTLTDVSDYAQFLAFVRENYLEEEVSQETQEPYGIDQALQGLFWPREQFESALVALRLRKNVILQGPPGVGKSFVARRLAWALMGVKDQTRLEMVQFHQSYAYEDFIQGWRPAEKGFELRSGIFYSFCEKARGDLSRPYVFIIDEINRGNVSRIFGELMILLEPDKRGAEHAIPLTYSQDGGRFSVPENVHLLGLMNTADRSLAMVDYALRRRFRFVELEPQFGDAFVGHLRSRGASEALIKRIVERMTNLNQQITSDHKNLGGGYVVGHSYFCQLGEGSVDEAWYRDVVLGEIAPLLKEYWFERREKAQKWIDELLAP